jgi:hypothetical protein
MKYVNRLLQTTMLGCADDDNSAVLAACLLVTQFRINEQENALHI